MKLYSLRKALLSRGRCVPSSSCIPNKHLYCQKTCLDDNTPRNMQHALLISGYWPEKDSSAAGVRTRGLITMFQKQASMTVSCLSHQKVNLVAKKFMEETAVALNDDSHFREVFQEIQPSLVVFDRFVTEEQWGWCIYKYFPETLCIIDTQDLHFIRQYREQLASNGKVCLQYPPFPTDAMVRELSAIHRSHLSFVCAHNEEYYLTQVANVPAHKVIVLPFLFNPEDPELPVRYKGYPVRKHYCMIGSFRHTPNVDAVLWLKDVLWPSIKAKLKKLGEEDAEVHVYGAYPQKEHMQLTSLSERFIVKGPIKSEILYSKLSRYRVNLAPLRYGAGIKGKIADGWRVGTPCVTTSVGAEGMTTDGGNATISKIKNDFNADCVGEDIDNDIIKENTFKGGVVHDDVGSFSYSSAKLYTDRVYWESLSSEANEVVKELFDEDERGKKIWRKISYFGTTVGKITKEADILGACFRHATLQQRELFSRYLKEKNEM